MSDQHPNSSQSKDNLPNLRDIPRFNYTGLDSTTGRYNYRERFYSCQASRSNQELESVSTSASSSRTTSPTNQIPISVEISRLTFTPGVQNAFDISESPHFISTMSEDQDNVGVGEEGRKVEGEDEVEVFDTTEEDEQWEILEDELGDFLDENTSLPLNSDDIDRYIERLEEYRRGYKRLERTLKKKVSIKYYNYHYSNPFDQVLYRIKECIKHAKNRKTQLREHETKLDFNDRTLKDRQVKEERLQQKQATDFLVTEVFRLIKELRNEFTKIGEADDEELMRRKDDYPENSLQLERLSHKLQEVYKSIPDDYDVTTIQTIKTDYSDLLKEKKSYDDDLQKRMKERELLKEKAFQTSALNIKLSKFSGYQCKLDIYSFQLEFEKMYNASTPKHR